MHYSHSEKNVTPFQQAPRTPNIAQVFFLIEIDRIQLQINFTMENRDKPAHLADIMWL